MTFKVKILILCLCIFSSPSFAQQDFFPFLAKVTADNVNIRAGQGKGFASLYQLHKGEEVVVVDKSYSWYQVELPKRSNSFVSAKFTRLLTDGRGEIMANRLNVRSGSGTQHSIVGQLKKGTMVTITKSVPGWYKIEPSSNLFGWIAEHLLVFKSNNVGLRKDVFIASTGESLNKEIPMQQKDIELTIKAKNHQDNRITIRGNLKPQRDEKLKNINYILVVNNQRSFYLQGLDVILDRFLHYQVDVEGILEENGFEDAHQYPIIHVLKAHIVL